MKKSVILACLVFLPLMANAHKLPVFHIPPNNKYNLFNYTYSPPIKPQNTTQSSEPSSPDINISGIFLSGGKRVVLIDYQILKEGDKIKGYTIEKILDGKVILSKGQRRIIKSISNDLE
ncbi:hypothetical protein [Hippea sp. KM1]|uniref:hypothetical protein n=1 Tax=Hippea sp. KM1 TaxID=944481 RepID=UPI00046D6AC5|nr:hypothetical protein [Hippea sp. KM1]